MASKPKMNRRLPITMRGQPVSVDSVKRFMEEWSQKQAEANHVETIDEANDFTIYDEEEDDLFQNYTVYEMHDQAEENLAALQEAQENDQVAESNETGDRAQELNLHDQSAPVEPNSLPSQTPSSLDQPEGASPTNDR